VWTLLRTNKKWWLLPILIALAAVGVLIAVAVAIPSAAPFIYSLF
jgi:ABC-type transporter Mla subunit MlaD